MGTRDVDRVLVGILVAVAAVTAASHWAGMSYSTWSDEVATATLAERPLFDMVRVFDQADGGYAGYLVLMNVWTSIFGASEVVLRIPSAAAAVVTIVLAGLLASRMGGRGAGVATGVLVAVHPFLLPQHFAEARPYALVAATVTGAALAAHVIRDGDRKIVVVAWSLAATLAISFHLLAVLGLAPQLLWLFGGRSRRGVARIAPALAPPGAMLVVMVCLAARATELQDWIPQVSVRTPRDAVHALFSAGGAYLLVAALVVIVVTQGLRPARAMVTAQAGDLMVLGLWILFPVVVLIVGSIAWSPMFLGRYMVSSTIAGMLATDMSAQEAGSLYTPIVGADEALARIDRIDRMFVAGYYDDGGTPLTGTAEVPEQVVDHLLRCWSVVDRADHGLVVELWERDTSIDGCDA